MVPDTEYTECACMHDMSAFSKRISIMA